MEKLKSERLQQLADMANEEIMETDENLTPYLLFGVILAVLLIATLCTIIYFGLGNQTVSVTLGTHFQKR